MGRFNVSPIIHATMRARELAAAGRDIINLSIGEPGFPTPAAAREAASRMMHEQTVGYPPITGTLALRQAIQHKFWRDNQLQFEVDQIAVSNGVKQILYNALMASLDYGDEVILCAPYWASYTDLVALCGARATIIRCPREHGFKLQPEQLAPAITPRTKWLILNSPNNPSGATYSSDELAALASVLLRHPQVYLLCDDIYEHLLFDGRRFTTMPAVEPQLLSRCLVCNGMSKAYSMSGWRLGFAAGPKALIGNMNKIQSQCTAGVSAVSQAAAAAALSTSLDEVKARTRDLQQRRDRLCERLQTIPMIEGERPHGALYVFYACARAIGSCTPAGKRIESDRDFTDYLLDAVGVASVPGEAFGLSPYFRACFALPEPRLMEAALRIAAACQQLRC